MKEREEVLDKPLFEDEKIYGSDLYRSICRSILIAFISGCSLGLGVFNFLEKNLLLMIIFIIASMILFCSSFLMGLKNLFIDIPLKGVDSDNE